VFFSILELIKFANNYQQKSWRTLLKPFGDLKIEQGFVEGKI
jgi:hypothetical protein